MFRDGRAVVARRSSGRRTASARRRRSRSSRRPSPSGAASPASSTGRTRAGPGRPSSRSSSKLVRPVVQPARRALVRRASRAAASCRSRTSSRTRGSCSPPIFLPMLQNTELIECWKPCTKLDVPEHLRPRLVGVARVRHLLAVLGAVAGIVEPRARRERPRVERGGGGDHLERRPRRDRAPASRG